MKLFVKILLLFSLLIPLKARELDANLKEYIKIGMRENLDLQSSKSTLKTYDAREKEAFANFLPKLDATTRYTKAGGGRTMDFAIGQMLNPIYDAIKLTDPSTGKTVHLDDITVPFILPQSQDSKLELIQPVFAPAIYYNYDAQSEMKSGAEYDYKAKELNLSEKIIVDYYNYAKAVRLVEIRNYGLTLASQGHNVAEKLFAVDKAPKTDVLRAEVQMSSSKQELMSAQNMVNLARQSFNTTLNRKDNDEIKIDSISVDGLINDNLKSRLEYPMTLDESINSGLKARPELKSLDYTMNSLESFQKANSSSYLPTISLALDYGIQGEKYSIDNQSRYWMVSGIISWNLFSGFSTSAKQQELEAQKTSAQKSSESIRRLIELEIKNNYINYINVYEQFQVAVKSYKSAYENYDLNKKRYEQGMNPFITLLDAETTLKITMENMFVTYYDVLTAKWRLVKSTGKILS